jgi:hypothetical protein
MVEEWRSVEGFEGRYEVSNMGRVRSLGTTPRHPAKVLRIRWARNGYGRVNITPLGGTVQTKNVHRLVAQAFLPRAPGTECVNHIDANKRNNCALNLEWSTLSDNNRHATVFGRRHASTNPKRAHKLTAEIAESIRADRRSGMTTSQVASKYGISSTVARRIHNGEIWAPPPASTFDALLRPGTAALITDDFGALVPTRLDLIFRAKA